MTTAARGAGVGLRVTEKDIERRCDSLMSQLCWNVVRFSQPRHTMQSSGIPDRKYYNVASGVTFWFECKKPGGKQSNAQKQFQQMCEACGETYVLGGVDELLSAIKSLTSEANEDYPHGRNAIGIRRDIMRITPSTPNQSEQ